MLTFFIILFFLIDVIAADGRILLSSIAPSPNPPCLTPFPHTPVPETWCSTPIVSKNGVQIAQYGFPSDSMLITASTNSSIWYNDALFFLGGGIYTVFEYLAGHNQQNQSLIANGRTVPFIIRPLSPLATPSGWWQTSMLISPSNYPDPSKIPLPIPNSDIKLEPLGTHYFATLSFNYSSNTTIVYPPYFPYFLGCTDTLLADLPAGWNVMNNSSFSPSWLLYNGQDFNGTWTSQCLVEVEPAKINDETTIEHEEDSVKINDESTHSQPPPPSAKVSKRASDTSTATTAAVVHKPPKNNNKKVYSIPTLNNSTAPPICGMLLEFETFYYGEWNPPHAPNQVLNSLEGGTDGLVAMDTVNRIVYMATVADAAFFTLGLFAFNVSNGSSFIIGNNWPYPPAGFDGVNGLFFSVDFDSSLGGLIVGMTEISKYGPLPSQPAEPNLPYGWTVIANVDPYTGNSIALTPDLSPQLLDYDPIVSGLSTLDTVHSILYLLTATENSSPLGPFTHPAGMQSSHFLGITLLSSDSEETDTAPPFVIIPSGGNGFIVCAFVYSSAVDAIVTIEFNASAVQNYWTSVYLPNAVIKLYYTNGTTPTVIGTIDAGKIGPAESIGQAEVSNDGQFVYFAATQGSNAFESAALVTINVLTHSFSLALANPDDEYDVLALVPC